MVIEVATEGAGKLLSSDSMTIGGVESSCLRRATHTGSMLQVQALRLYGEGLRTTRDQRHVRTRRSPAVQDSQSTLCQLRAPSFAPGVSISQERKGPIFRVNDMNENSGSYSPARTEARRMLHALYYDQALVSFHFVRGVLGFFVTKGEDVLPARTRGGQSLYRLVGGKGLTRLHYAFARAERRR